MLLIFFGIREDVKEIKGIQTKNKVEQSNRGTGSFTGRRQMTFKLGQFIDHSAAQTTEKQAIIYIQTCCDVF